MITTEICERCFRWLTICLSRMKKKSKILTYFWKFWLLNYYDLFQFDRDTWCCQHRRMMPQQPIEDTEATRLLPNTCHILWLLAVVVTRKKWNIVLKYWLTIMCVLTFPVASIVSFSATISSQYFSAMDSGFWFQPDFPWYCCRPLPSW